MNIKKLGKILIDFYFINLLTHYFKIKTPQLINQTDLLIKVLNFDNIVEKKLVILEKKTRQSKIITVSSKYNFYKQIYFNKTL